MGKRKIDNEKIARFEVAFHSGGSHNRHYCNCGKTYYDIENDYDWEKGELEKLEKDDSAISVNYSIGVIGFEGRFFADACDCWHERAMQIMNFIDGHIFNIAEYINNEKAYNIFQANSMPEVDND